MGNQDQRRLLDLLAGWHDYVRKCAESETPHVGVTREEYLAEADKILDLYQKVGRNESFDDGDVLCAMLLVTAIVMGEK